MPRSFIFYLTVLLLFGAGIWFILDYGSRMTGVEAVAAAPSTPVHPGIEPEARTGRGIAAAFAETVKEPLSILLLQVIVIVAAARALGALFRKIGQPSVIGEMVAGILLGPSLLGWVAPGLQVFLFPSSSMGALRLLSQIGVILFMFVVGIELDVQHLRRRADAVLLVSHAGILAPFFLGAAAALLLYRSLAPSGVPFSTFALFIGVSMSITAFPVLARILEERRLSNSQLGATAIACAAVGDVTAWCLLAVVVAIVRANGLAGSVMTIALTLLFIVLMFFAVKPLAARIASRAEVGNGGSGGLLAGILAFVFASALVTELIGIHALFGAFLAGVCMPPDSRLRQFLRERLETFSSVFLLPLFFAFTGLRTQAGLLADWQSWLVCAGIIAVAIAGKLGGSMIAARFTGMGWGDSFALGSLMNTRGLIELIALNLGYDLGVLSPRIFAMLVLMALVTTFMTGPLLHLRDVLSRRTAEAAAPTGSETPV
jgi:Kef-type K+ transport system membrane component KefB